MREAELNRQRVVFTPQEAARLQSLESVLTGRLKVPYPRHPAAGFLISHFYFLFPFRFSNGLSIAYSNI